MSIRSPCCTRRERGTLSAPERARNPLCPRASEEPSRDGSWDGKCADWGGPVCQPFLHLVQVSWLPHPRRMAASLPVHIRQTPDEPPRKAYSRLAGTHLGPPLLRVEVDIPVCSSVVEPRPATHAVVLPLPERPCIPLFGPFDGIVAKNHRRQEVKDLASEPPPRVENSVVAGPGKGVLPVRGDAVGDDALLLLGVRAWGRSDIHMWLRARSPVRLGGREAYQGDPIRQCSWQQQT